MSPSKFSAVICAVAIGVSASAVNAATVAGLVDGTSIIWVDTDAKAVTKTVKIDGAPLVGIDVRPADKMLYGVSADGKIMIVDPATGKTTMKSQISEALPKGVDMVVDFNPVADRLRMIGSDGTSLRINVDDGKATVDGRLKYAETDANKGKAPKVSLGAYTNSTAGTKETALYDIDVAAGVLVKQAPPNDGILNTVGPLGIKLDGPLAFDIAADGKGGNAAWLMAGTELFSIDLATGKATSAAKISGVKGKIIDIAIMPAM
jgi:Domain of unknown function (DUF4394)